MIKLNLGCGHIRPDGWVNADSSINTLIQKWILGKWLAKKLGAIMFDTSNVTYMNLNQKWHKIKDNTVNVVYASHLYEHLEIDKAKVFISEAYRTLHPNGCLRLVMPDLYAHCKEYVSNIDKGQTDASKHLLWALNLYKKGPDDKLSIIHIVLGLIQGEPHRHKYMYDRLTMTKIFTDQGFKEIRFCTYGQSYYISDINDIEGPHLYGEYPNSIYIEALK